MFFSASCSSVKDGSMVLSFLAKQLQARGGISHGFLIRSLAAVTFCNVVYRIAVPPPLPLDPQQQQQQQQQIKKQD